MADSYYQLIKIEKFAGRYQRFETIALVSIVLITFMHYNGMSLLFTPPPMKCHQNESLSSLRELEGSSRCEKLNAWISVCGNLTYNHDLYRNTIFEKFDARCGDNFSVERSNRAYDAGHLVGVTIFTFLVDWFGRIRSLILMSVLACIAMVTSISVDDYLMVHTITRFISGTCGIVMWLCAYISVYECALPQERNGIMIVANISHQIGRLLFFFGLNVFKSVTTISYIMTSILVVVPILCVPLKESRRWLLASGRIEQFKTAMESIAIFNGEKVKTDDNPIEAMLSDDGDFGENSVVKMSFIRFIQSFFRSKDMRKVTLIMIFDIASLHMVHVHDLRSIPLYFSPSLTASNLIYGILSVCILGFTFSKLIRINKIPIAIVLHTLYATILYVVMGMTLLESKATHYHVKYFIQIMFEMCLAFDLNYTVELNPTTHRCFAVGMITTAAVCSVIVIPIVHSIVQFWTPLPVLIYGVMLICSGLLFIYMPETRNESIDTIQHVETLIKRNDERIMRCF